MKKMQKAGIVMLSAGVLGGVAPAVAPSVLNLNGGVVHAAEKTHKVTVHYTLYDDLMFHLESSSSGSSKVFDVTPNQPLSDYIPEKLPGGYVFQNVGRHSGGTVGDPLRTRNHLFGNWTDIYVDYILREMKPRTNPSNAGTNNNEKPHKVTIFYCLFDGIPREPIKKVVYVTPNQPLSDHIPETLPDGYKFTNATANGGGEGGVLLSYRNERNDLFGNETVFYAYYSKDKKDFVSNPGKELKLLNGSVVPDGENVVSVAYGFDGMDYGTRVNVNIAENPNATVGDYYPLTKDGADLKYITDGKTRLWVYNPSLGVDLRGDLLSKHSHLLGAYTEPMLGEYTQPNNAGTNNNASAEVKPNNDGNANAGANNNAGTNAGTNDNAGTNAGTNNNADTEVKPNNGNTNAGTNNNAGTEVKPNNGNTNAGTNNNASTEVKPNNGNTNAGTNNNAGTEVKPGNNDNTGNNKPENKPVPENKPNNNSNAENTNTNNNVTPSEDIINNIFSNDASGVKVTLTDKTTAVKLSATPVEDKALASSVLEKLNLPADNQIRILDLKLLDKDNHVVNSNAKRTVAIVLKEDEKDVNVYHIKDNGELELINSTIKDGKVTFEIDHFSKFAIVSNTNKPSNSPSENSTSNNVNKLLPKTGLANSNLTSLVTLGLILSGAAIFSRRKNRR